MINLILAIHMTTIHFSDQSDLIMFDARELIAIVTPILTSAFTFTSSSFRSSHEPFSMGSSQLIESA